MKPIAKRTILIVLALVLGIAPTLLVLVMHTIMFLTKDPRKSYFGCRFYSVSNASMTPVEDAPPGGFYKDSMLVAKLVAPEDIAVGDVVLFNPLKDHGQSFAFLNHRVMKIMHEQNGVPGLYFQTKGDANPEADAVISANQVIGKVTVRVRGLGLVLRIMRDQAWLTLLLSVSMTALGWVLAVLVWPGRKPMNISDKATKGNHKMKQPVLLCIMDGFGIASPGDGNAIAAAKTPRLDALFAAYPHTQIGASGLDVGLPEGQMGNSEVGHTNIGAGRVVYQELTRITKAIQDGDFFENEVLLAAVENCKRQGSALHLMGLLSDGGVHSHNSHLYALLELAKRHGLKDVFIHCLMDGRDVPPTSGKGYVEELFAKTQELGIGQIITIAGRYYGMDREKKWDRVQKLFDAVVQGKGAHFECGRDYMQASYDQGITDEFIIPAISTAAQPLNGHDSVIFFNFRPDRAREITRAFVDPAFDGFVRAASPELFYVCMTQYDASMPNVHVAFAPQSLANPLGQVLSEHNLKQLRIAEYTKYAHVTFFLNGGEETVYPGEDRIMIDSPNVATYDMQPEMSAYLVTEQLEELIAAGKYDVIVLNFANCDMVGHTGIFEAAVAAVEAVDACVGRVWDALHAQNGVLLLTADHGNADQMKEPNGEPFTAHTTNPVPFLVAGCPCKLREGGRLSDIAPTMLHVMGIAQPEEMTGQSLINAEC